jgi:hypothetical protein
MNFKYDNKDDIYILDSNTFKDFWFLKCQLVGEILNNENDFSIKKEHLQGFSDLDEHSSFCNYEDVLNLLVYHKGYTTEFVIDLFDGKTIMKIHPYLIRENYSTPPDFPFATKEWLFDNIDINKSFDEIIILKPEASVVLNEIIFKKRSGELLQWLVYLSGLPRVPDPDKPPCSVECPNKFMMVTGGVEVCKDKLYKVL